jgi:short subunit dehydrogenase-like uncharacterized protein
MLIRARPARTGIVQDITGALLLPGCSGKLLAEYLVSKYLGSAKIALAGRSKEKLEGVRRRFWRSAGPRALARADNSFAFSLCNVNPSAKDIPILIGDSANLSELIAIAERTRVVATTVGPCTKPNAPTTYTMPSR